MPALRILHLEDDAFDIDLVQREVARLGVVPTWLNIDSADDFFRAIDGARYDAIMSDGRIPGIDGLVALQAAKAKRPGVPFIFVSGNSDPRWAEHCIGEGATDYVPKSQLWRLPSALKRLGAARDAERLAWLTDARAALIDIVKALSLARSVQAIVDIVRQGARQLSHADGATFVLREGELCHYIDEDAISPLWKGSRFPMSTCISGWAMLNGAPAVIPDIYLDERIPHDAYRPTFVKSLVMVPIRAAAPIGAIGCYWAGEHEASPEEVEVIQALADSTSLAFENVALVEGLEQRVAQRTAELEAANRDLSAFSYSVSHDLRAPLRAIRGYGDLLASQAGAALQGQAGVFLDNIRHSAQRMETLIEDMLSLATLTRAEVQKRPVALGSMARHVLKDLQLAAPDRQVRVEVDTSLMAHGDAGLLRLALENLLSNAWKFSGRRDDACVEFFAEAQPDGRLAYCVRDNGAGFDMAQAGPMFEPFRRLHREAEFPGTGIGLAIVQRVVQKHGGEIWAQSRPGEGACFYFVLPPA